jgi:hypothetical protein
MRIIRWVSVVMVAALTTACQPKTPPPPPPPVEPTPTAQMSMQLKQQILQDDPLAKVGQVTEVMPQDSTVAVQGVNANDIRMGDAMLVVGGNMNTIARGIVTNFDRQRNVLVLKYQDLSDPRRPPQAGDLAVRMSDHPLPRGAHVPIPSDQGASQIPTNVPTNPPPTGQPAPATQPTNAPTGGGDSTPQHPADGAAPTSDNKPAESTSPAPDASKPANGGATDTPAPKPEFNK